MELMNCPSLAVPTEVMRHVVRVESSNNPFAIGVVGGRLARQPRNLPEALATVRLLESRGYNFSVGLAQVNRYNLKKYGLGSYEKAFQGCPNLQAGSRILADCHGRSGGNWGKSFSCYYSGNFVTGFRQGYVQKVYASMREDAIQQPIEVLSRAMRRSVPVSRHPLYETAHRADTVATATSNQTLATQPTTAAGVEANADMRSSQVPADLSAPVVVTPMAAETTPTPATVPVPPGQGADQAFVF